MLVPSAAAFCSTKWHREQAMAAPASEPGMAGPRAFSASSTVGSPEVGKAFTLVEWVENHWEKRGSLKILSPSAWSAGLNGSTGLAPGPCRQLVPKRAVHAAWERRRDGLQLTSRTLPGAGR